MFEGILKFLASLCSPRSQRSIHSENNPLAGQSYTCPECRKVMELLKDEYEENRYWCPDCESHGKIPERPHHPKEPPKTSTPAVKSPQQAKKKKNPKKPRGDKLAARNVKGAKELEARPDPTASKIKPPEVVPKRKTPEEKIRHDSPPEAKATDYVEPQKRSGYKFTCPKCEKLMDLWVSEHEAHRYTCAYCKSTGTVAVWPEQIRSTPQVAKSKTELPAKPEPKAIKIVYCDPKWLNGDDPDGLNAFEREQHRYDGRTDPDD